MRLYRAISASLCAAFAVVGTLFLLLPNTLVGLFDRWSADVGLASFPGDAGFFVVLAVAYMYLVTLLAWRMVRDPGDPAPARLLVHAKLASSLVSFALFLLDRPHLLLLVNGIVDGAIAVGVVLLLHASAARAEPAP